MSGVSDTCVNCGSRLEKECGGCGFLNALEKSCCDQCGGLLTFKAGQSAQPGGDPVPAPPPVNTRADTSAACGKTPSREIPPEDNTVRIPPQKTAEAEPSEKNKFQFEIQPIQEAMAEKDASFRNRVPGKGSPVPVLSTAAPSVQPPPPVTAPPAPAPPPMPPRPGKAQYAPRYFAGINIYGALILAGLLALFCFFLYLLAVPYIPRFSLKMAANSYLKRLSTGRYEEAYAMLSTNSKSACSMKSFVEYNQQYYGKVPSWKFSGVEIFAIEPDAAMMRYQLKEGTGSWHTDYISFVKEHNKWMRPYIWMLFDPIDTAITRQDYPQALFLAQKLFLTDPIDPRTSGYLCVSEFFMGLYDKAADSCRKTVVSAAIYPVGFTDEEVFWFKFYYADSLRFVQRLKPALDEYGELLKSEGISLKERCPLFLSRADAYVKLHRYDAALDDMLKADDVCVDETNRAEVVRRMRFMNGDARAAAISFAQQTKSRADLPPFGELRRKELDAIAARLGPRNIRYMPKDEWVAAHLTGPEYRVVLRQESLNPRTRQKDFTNVYVFMVNLWTGVIRLEEGALPSRQEASGY